MLQDICTEEWELIKLMRDLNYGTIANILVQEGKPKKIEIIRETILLYELKKIDK